MRRHADATLRNRAPLLAVLARHVRPGDAVLEVASGTGQHAVFFAPRLGATWQPTDPDPDARASIDAWRAADRGDPAGAALDAGDACLAPWEVLPARALDVRERPWPVARPDVVLCVNMVHIAPWEGTRALLAEVGALRPRRLVFYGPYRRHGAHTAPSNEAFDAWLRARDPASGVRDLEALLTEAALHGLALEELVEMPANNLAVVLRTG